MWKKFLIPFAICLILFLSLFGGVLSQQSLPAIQGYVYNHERQPVPGAAVVVKDSKTGEIYGNGTTDENGYYKVLLAEKAVGKQVDIYWEKDGHKRDEMGYLIPKKDFVSRPIYTYMTVNLDEKTITAFVYNYPSGEGVANVTLIAEDAETLQVLAKATTDADGVAKLLVPANLEVNVWANPNGERGDILGGQELGVHTVSDTIVTIYVETL